MNEPLPPFPPLEDNDQIQAAQHAAAIHLVKLHEFAFRNMYDIVSGFRDLKPRERMASYLKWASLTGIPDPVEGLNAYFSMPQQVRSSQVDPLTGMPVMIPLGMSLMQLSSSECAWMLSDAAKLFAKEQQAAILAQTMNGNAMVMP